MALAGTRAQEIEQEKISRHRSLGIKVTEERISGLFALLDYKMEVVIEDLYKTQQAMQKKHCKLQEQGLRFLSRLKKKNRIVESDH